MNNKNSPACSISCDAMRTCPACGGTLRLYPPLRFLACLSCVWGIGDAFAMEHFIDLIDQIKRDRDEQAALEAELRGAP
jgi:hypothetical protein